MRGMMNGLNNLNGRLQSLCLVLSLVMSVFTGMGLCAFAEEQGEELPAGEEIQVVDVAAQSGTENAEEISQETLENTEETVQAKSPELPEMPEAESPVEDPDAGSDPEAGSENPEEPVTGAETPENSLTIEVPENDPVPVTVETPTSEVRLEIYLDRPEEFELADGTKKQLTPEEAIRTFTVEEEHCENILKDARPDELVRGYEGVTDGKSRVFSFAYSGGSGTMEYQWFKKAGEEYIPAAMEEGTGKPLSVLSVAVPDDSGYYYLELRFLDNGEIRERVRSNIIFVQITSPAQTEPQQGEDTGIFLTAVPGTEQTEQPVEQNPTEETFLSITVPQEQEENQNQENPGQENITDTENASSKKAEENTQPENTEENAIENTQQENNQQENNQEENNQNGQNNESPVENQEAAEELEPENAAETLPETTEITFSLAAAPAPVLTGAGTPVSYDVTNEESDGRILWQKGSAAGPEIHCSGEQSKFQKLTVSLGEETKAETTVSVVGQNNTTIVTLDPDDLNSLTDGVYTVKLTYTDGYAETELLVLSKSIEVEVETVWQSAEESVYDGKAKTPGVIVRTKTGGRELSADQYNDPSYSNNVNAGTNTASVTVTSKESGKFTFTGTAYFSIAPATPKITLNDKTTYYNRKEVTVDKASVQLVNGENYVGSVQYTYFTDSACTRRLSSAPVASGTYYAVAETAAFGNYTAGKSNTARIIIIYAAKTVSASSSSGYASVISDKTAEIIYGESYTFRAKVTQAGYYIGRVYVNGVNVGSPNQYSDGTYYYTYSNNDPTEFMNSQKVSIIFQVYDSYGSPATGDNSKVPEMLGIMVASLCMVMLCLRVLRKKHR